jgi:hypothetical protein
METSLIIVRHLFLYVPILVPPWLNQPVQIEKSCQKTLQPCAVRQHGRKACVVRSNHRNLSVSPVRIVPHISPCR